MQALVNRVLLKFRTEDMETLRGERTQATISSSDSSSTATKSSTKHEAYGTPASTPTVSEDSFSEQRPKGNPGAIAATALWNSEAMTPTPGKAAEKSPSCEDSAEVEKKAPALARASQSKEGDRNDTAMILHPELRDLKVIAVEEHFRAAPQLMSRFGDGMVSQLKKQLAVSISGNAHQGFLRRFNGGPEQRVQDMDNNLISFQLLSRAATVNAIPMEAEEGAALTRDLNDDIKKTVDSYPNRFAALCELPFQAPKLAKEELQRCVNELGFKGAMLHGTVEGKFLDAPEFDELLSMFEELDVPLYLHPGIPPKAVSDAYYSFDGKPDLTLALMGPGWGWHQEVAIHVLRLAVSGTLDRHPRLKIVIGHQGEMLPMMMERFGSAFDPKMHALQRTVPEMLRSQVWIAISGFFSVSTTQLSIAQWGTDRVLFANDYPFVEAQSVPQFLTSLGNVVAPSDMRKICQTNAAELFKISV